MTAKAPRWLLSDEWAVDTDPYNWILLRRAKKKDGSRGRWAPAGYYPTAEQLLQSLYRKAGRSEPLDADLARHLEATASAIEACSARFLAGLRGHPWPTLQEAANT